MGETIAATFLLFVRKVAGGYDCQLNLQDQVKSKGYVKCCGRFVADVVTVHEMRTLASCPCRSVNIGADPVPEEGRAEDGDNPLPRIALAAGQ